MQKAPLSFIFLLFCFCQIPFPGIAQPARVVTALKGSSSAQSPVVLIKFYSRQFIYKEGVYLYKRKVGEMNWTRIAEKPLRMKATIPSDVLRADPEIDEYFKLADAFLKATKNEDMMTFNLMVKSFQSNDFADLIGIYFEDSNIVSGQWYEYKVNRISKGKEVPLAVSEPVLATQYTAALPIDSISIFRKDNKIAFNWKHEEERFYAVNIYRRSGPDSTAVKLNKQPLMISQVLDSAGRPTYPNPMFAEDRNLKESTSYSYQFTGVGFFGLETQRSKPVQLYFKDTTPPPAPANLTGRADSMKVYLKWETGEAPDLIGVNLYRSGKSDGPYAIVNKSVLKNDVLTFEDSLDLAGPYYYFVAARDSSGNESHSNLIFVEVQDVIPPAPPMQLEIKADTGVLHLTWQMGVEPDLAGYYLYRTVDAHDAKRYVLLNAEPLRSQTFTQQLPKNVKNKFFYYIVAVDTSYNRSKPSEFVTARMPDILAPEKPFIKNVSYENDVITLNWIQNVDSDLMGYNLYRTDTSRNFVRLNISTLGRETFRYVDRTHEPNADYYYYLEAFDSAGNVSVKSNEAYGRRFEKENADEKVIIDLKIKHRRKKDEVQLSWNVDEDGFSGDRLQFIVFRGDSEDLLTPQTGLISEKKFSVRESIERNPSQTIFYQVRAYAGAQVYYSKLINFKT